MCILLSFRYFHIICFCLLPLCLPLVMYSLWCKAAFVHGVMFYRSITPLSSCKKYIKAKALCVIVAVFFHVRKEAFPLRYCHKGLRLGFLRIHSGSCTDFLSDLIGLFSVSVEKNAGYTFYSCCCRETTGKPHNFPHSHFQFHGFDCLHLKLEDMSELNTS